MNPRILRALGALILVAPAQATRQETPSSWPQWRGPNQDGVSPAKGLPTKWGPDENIVWKAPLPSWSGATPIVWGDRIFVMSPSGTTPEELEQEERAREERESQGGGRGRRGRGGGGGGGRGPGGSALLLLCFRAADGALLWERELDEGNELHRKGNNASPSPVTDGEHVWAVTGNGEVTALDMDGEPVWSRNLQEDYGAFGHNWGYACSPVLFDGKLVIEVLHGSHTDEPSYVVAFDAATGEPVWKVDRPTDAPRESPDAYTTPLLFRHAGETQIVISGGDVVTGHDPKTGVELWRVAGLNPRAASNYRIIASPLAAGDMIYAPTRVEPLLAIHVGEEARPTEANIAWQYADRGAPDVPTPACDGTLFYMISDSGSATCLDAKTGEVIWGPERTVPGTVSSSPLLADGKLWFTTEEGITVVLAAGRKFEQLAANELDGSYTLSSPVAVGNRLYVRTEEYLYCIGESGE